MERSDTKIKVLLQCSKGKQDGGYFEGKDGKVFFVAKPNGGCENKAKHVHPDDDAPNSTKTWRELVVEYNDNYKRTGENPLGLHEAYKLYNPIFKQYTTLSNSVYEHPSFDFYIISDGWGIVPADFLIPQYSVSFSAYGCYKRTKRINFKDFNYLKNSKDDLICLCYKSIRDLSKELTQDYKGDRRFFFFDEEAYDNDKRRWIYKCLRDLINDYNSCNNFSIDKFCTSHPCQLLRHLSQSV